MASSEGVAANLTSMAPTTICGVCHLKTSHDWGKEIEAEYVYYCLHCFMGLICILIPVLAHLDWIYIVSAHIYAVLEMRVKCTA